MTERRPPHDAAASRAAPPPRKASTRQAEGKPAPGLGGTGARCAAARRGQCYSPSWRSSTWATTMHTSSASESIEVGEHGGPRVRSERMRLTRGCSPGWRSFGGLASARVSSTLPTFPALVMTLESPGGPLPRRDARAAGRAPGAAGRGPRSAALPLRHRGCRRARVRHGAPGPHAARGGRLGHLAGGACPARPVAAAKTRLPTHRGRTVPCRTPPAGAAR
jgi:hypothetical protein